MKMPSGHFCGIRLKSDLVTDFTFIESLYLPNQKYAKHSHERASLCLVLRGDFTETHGRNSLTCAPSTLLFYPAGVAHAESFNLRTRCLVIEINPSWLERLDQFQRFVNQPANFHGGKASGLAVRAYKEFRAPDEFSNLSIEGLLFEMVAEISRCSRQTRDRRPSRRVELVRELIQAQFREPPTIAAIAQQVGLHPVYLAQAFRRVYGCTVGEYVRKLRIEFACSELFNPDIRISKVAADAGFFDQSHFSRTFKQLMGVTPAEYRKTFGQS